MSDWKNIYRSKLVSVREAAAKIASGDRIWFGSSTSTPIQLMDAVVDRYAELTDVHIISSLFLYDFKVLQDAKYIGHIKGHSAFVGPQERLYHKLGNIDNNSVPFSKVCIALRDYYRVDTLAVDVSLPDEEGYLYWGACGVDWHGEIAGYAKKIIVQVNKYQPRIKGPECRIHVSQVDYICEADHSFPVFPQREPTDTDKQIAAILIDQIPDGACIQLGIGGLANAIGYRLEEKKNLSVYTEMFTDSMMHLLKKGVITGKIVAGFSMGSPELYEFLAAGQIELTPLRITNDENIIGQNDNLISINGCLMSDLTGQVCSESLGFTQYSSIGGQGDFVRGALRSKGGKSFLCMPSTIRAKDNRMISTISVALPPGAVVTVQRCDVMYVVTEYGIADLYLKSIPDRVNAMISIAHPDFREALRREAIAVGLIVR